MVNKKNVASIDSDEEDSPFDDEILERLPIGFRSMVKKETNTIGELYKRAKFSKSVSHQAAQYMNYPLFKPISNLLLDTRESQEETHE